MLRENILGYNLKDRFVGRIAVTITSKYFQGNIINYLFIQFFSEKERSVFQQNILIICIIIIRIFNCVYIIINI